jgi:hypothetical protein
MILRGIIFLPDSLSSHLVGPLEIVGIFWELGRQESSGFTGISIVWLSRVRTIETLEAWEGRIMETNYPVPIVRLIIQDGEGSVLILKRDHTTHALGTWCLPGGKINYGEMVVEAAARELHEETAQGERTFAAVTC